MMNSSVRFRITLWYVAALAAVLLLFSAGVYSLLSNTLHARLDSTLRSAAQITDLTLNHEIEEHNGRAEGEKSVQDVLRTMHQTSFPQTGIAIWDGDRLVAEKPGLAGLPARSLGPVRSAEHAEALSTRRSGSLEYRVAIKEARVPFIGAVYQVTANESLEDVEAELANLRYVFLLSVPVCVLLAASGGYFLARKSLRPVSQMARTVEQISSANLQERLAVNSADELGRLGDTFNRLLDRLERAFGQQQRFMADASHELRTPLSVALTAAQVTLRKRDRDEHELREALALVEEQLRRLKRVVEDMFTLAHADAGAYQPSIAPFYLNEVADEALRAARVLARTKQIEIREEHPERDLAFDGDEGLIRQLLLIVLDNAVKYTPAGGRVSFTLQPSKTGYQVDISDTGPGISPADEPFIFDRFYRTDKARSRRDPGAGSGSGLGLSIARWIAGLHGGTIGLTPAPVGSTFRIWLPYDEPISETPEQTVGVEQGSR